MLRKNVNCASLHTRHLKLSLKAKPDLYVQAESRCRYVADTEAEIKPIQASMNSQMLVSEHSIMGTYILYFPPLKTIIHLDSQRKLLASKATFFGIYCTFQNLLTSLVSDHVD